MRAGIMILLIMVSGCIARQPGNSTRAVTADAVESLRIRIAEPERELVCIGQNRQPLHVVIENVSSQPTKIFDEWNSWGYFSLKLNYMLSSGVSSEMHKVPGAWAANAPTFTILRPGQVIVRDIQFDPKIWENIPDLKKGETTLTLKAIFEQTEKSYHDIANIHAWHGRFESAPLALVFYKSD